MPLIQRYSKTVKGALTYTGNTLGFSDITNGGWSGIGAFLSTISGLNVPGYTIPSTLNWQENGSTAVLNLPAGSTVLYAELIWGGAIIGEGGTLPLSVLNTPVTFKTPLGSNAVTFSPVTAFQNSTSDGQTFYTRSQDVTDLVGAAGAGTYEVDGVPAVHDPDPAYESCAGWVLAVSYGNSSLTYSNLNIYVGNVAINQQNPPVDTIITGFSTPVVGSINTRVLISAMQGDPPNQGDKVSLGANVGSLMTLSGPNNLVDDFFAGQINNDAGLLDTTGSFGTLNQGPPPTSVPGVRSGWDITNIDGSPAFVNSQTSAVLRISTSFDTYAVSTFGIQIQSGAPNINLIKAADTQVVAGSPISYSIQIENSGTLTTDNFLVTDLAPAGTTINVGSITITGATGPIINNSTTSGLNIEVGAVGIGQFVTINYTVNTTVNTPYPVLNTAISNYNFTPVPGSTINDTIPSNQTSTNLILADLRVVKTVYPNYITTGDLAVYTVVISNLGPSAAQSVSLVDVVPGGLSGVQYSIDNGLNWSNWSSPYNIGVLAAANSITVLIRGTASQGTLGTIVNTATVSSSTPDPDLNNNVNSANVNVNIAPISAVKTADKTSVAVGQILTYTVTVTNTGNVVANPVTITDVVPNGTSYVPGSLTVNTIANVANPNTGVQVGPIAPGQIVPVTFTVVVNTLPNPSTMVNAAVANYQYIVNPNSLPVSATTISNPATTPVGNVVAVKSVAPQYADLGQLLTYTVTLTNAGYAAVTNVPFVDTIPNGTTYANNFTLFGSGFTGSDPQSGLIINSITPGTPVVISWKVQVNNTIPNPNTIPNIALITIPGTTIPITTNTVTTAVNNANLLAPGNFVKSADKQFANVGDEITYTINMKNTGNTIANNVVINDSIPSGTSYVAGSLSANVLVTGTPAGGINVTNGIAPGATLTLSYRVHVDVIPATNPIPNTASVKYNYTVDPANQNGASGSGNSNTVTTQVNHGEILPQNAIKSVDKNPTTPGDIITYTITGANTGNVPIDVVITDVLPSGTSFISGTVIINGVSKPVGDPSLGVNVGTILASGTFTLVFKLNVLENAPSSLINGADIRYSYIVNPNLPPVIRDTATNTVNTTVLKSKLTMTKSADRIGAVVGDIVRYSIIATNTGEVPLQNVIVSDILAAELSYVGNLTINNMPSNQSILTGVNVGSLVVGQGVEISFDVKVIGIPTSKNINNEATSVFNYTVSGSKFNGTTVSNVETFTVYDPSFTMTKTSSKTAVKVGDTFVYTTVIKNTGDIDLNSVIMKDNLPSEFKVTGITVDAVAITGDLKTGIDVGTIGVGQNKTVQITILVTGDLSGTFNNVVTGSAQVTTDPNKTPTKVNSNGTDNSGVQVFNPKLTIIKSLDKPYAVIGETVTYTVTAKNTGDMTLGNVELSPITIFDILSQSLEFIGGSVTVDGISDPLSGIVTGVDLGQLIPGQSRILTFKAKVISNSINPITNTSNGTFGFKLPGYPPEVGSSTSNVVNLVPEVANIDVSKTSDADFAVLGNTIVYTVTLKNTGTLDALNVIFKDSLPTSVQLVDGSFSVNGVVINNIDPNLGVNIGTIKKGGEAIVKYTVKVVGSNCDLKIINGASVKFNYKLPDGRSGSFESEKTTTSSVEITLGISNFKQLSVEENLTIPTEKPDIEEVGEVTSEITIIKSHIIKTSILESNEGQRLTGYKLIVHGVIEEVVEYTALNEEQSVHSAHYSIPFTTFIVLPENYCNGGKVEIIPVVEDVYYRKIDNRSLFTNATILIKATGCNC